MDVLRFRWNGSMFHDVSQSPQLNLLVADSFFVRNGSAVAVSEHALRFSRSAQTQGLIASVEDFYGQALALIPDQGEYFPRIDVTERGELEITIRPTPPRFDTAIVGTASNDPRTEPGIKGPDIPALNALREEIRATGGDEAVICTSENFIIDGATSAVVWTDGHNLFVPPTQFMRVSSTTLGQLLELANMEVVEMAATPDMLSGFEVYILNALHGIRAVTQWDQVPELVTNHDRLNQWRSAYDSRFEKLLGNV